MTATQTLQQLYIGYFGRAADPEGLTYWMGELANGVSIDVIAQSFSEQPEALATYPYLKFPELVGPESFLSAVYENLFGRAIDAEGLEYWAGVIESGVDVGLVINWIIGGADDADKATLAAKAEFAHLVTTDVAASGQPWTDEIAATSREGLALINDPSDLDAAEDFWSDAQEPPPPADQVIQLKAGPENLTGGSGDDLFLAERSTWDSTDVLNGGDGTDTFQVITDRAITRTANFSNIENVLIDTGLADNTTRIDFRNSTGIEHVTYAGTGAGDAELTNLQAPVEVSLVGGTGDGDLNLGFASTVATGAADEITLNLVNAQRDDLRINGAFETLNVVVDGDSELDTVRVQNLSAVTIEGDGDLSLSSFRNSGGLAELSSLSSELNGDLSVEDVDIAAGGSLALAGMNGDVSINTIEVGDGGSIAAGGLNGNISIGNAFLGAGASIAAAAQNGTVSIGYAQLGQGGSIALGEGNDLINQIDLVGAQRTGTITLGGGNDAISVGGITNAAFSLDAGTGDDTVRVSNIGTGTTLVGGEGTDTLLTNTAAAVGAKAGLVSGFEALSLSGALAVGLDISKFAGAKSLTLEDGFTGAAGVTKLLNDSTVTVGAGSTGTLALSLATNTAEDSLNLVLRSDGFVDFADFDVRQMESLRITADATNPEGNDTFRASILTTETKLRTLTIDGDADTLELDGGVGGIFSNVVRVDASAFAGGVVASLGAGPTTGVTFEGGAGADDFTGAERGDTLSGNDGNDSLNGLEGNDVISGDGGNDVINGGTGRDTLTGGDGDDSIIGGLDDADDSLAGGAGNDTLVAGNTDKDMLDGGAGDDSLLGSLGANQLVGGEGADVINGLAGNDTIEAGAGADRFLFASTAAANGLDALIGFEAGVDADAVDLTAFFGGAALSFVGDRTASSANTTLADSSVSVITLNGNIAGIDYAGADFADLFGGGVGQFGGFAAAGAQSLVVVRGDDQAQFYFANDLDSDGVIDAAEVGQVATVTGISGTFVADNFLIA